MDVVVVLLVGPQASGKSTVARALAVSLRERGQRVALVELDQIAEMALPTLPGWDVAGRIFGLVVSEWAASDLTCIVAEGVSSQDEVATFVAQMPSGAAVVTVAMTTPFEAALLRAQADDTRGMSRDRDWLADRYEEWAVEMTKIDADLRLDMSSLSVSDGVTMIADAIESSR